ncbi:MAG: cohesin domain-containing protein, partial [Lachnospiraceae bacterium]
MAILHRKKSFISLILGLMLAFMVSEVKAAEQVEFHIETGKGKKGDVIQVPIRVNENSSIGGFDLTVLYDTELLEYQETKKGNILKKEGFFDSNMAEGGGSVRLVYGSLKGIEKQGVLVTMSFQLLQDTNQKVPVEIKINDLVDASLDLHDLSYQVTTNGRTVELPEAAGQTADKPANKPADKLESSNTNATTVQEQAAPKEKMDQSKEKGGTTQNPDADPDADSETKNIQKDKNDDKKHSIIIPTVAVMVVILLT